MTAALSPSLLRLYGFLGGGILLGILLGHRLPRRAAFYLGTWLFWVGVPITIIAFLRGTNLAGLVWLAPVAAWAAIFVGGMLALLLMVFQPYRSWRQATQGSFLLTSMMGNTGYLGYPVVLALLGPQYFAWALFYDLLGTTLGAYGLGVGVAAYFGGQRVAGTGLWWQIFKSPPLWSFGLGVIVHPVPLAPLVDQGLQSLAWLMVGLSIILLGMRLSHLSSWQSLPQATLSLGIKMLLVPLVLGLLLTKIGVSGPPRLALVLQMAMPPAFATLVLTETYGLDKDLTVTTLAVGAIALLLTLPLWLWLFGS